MKKKYLSPSMYTFALSPSVPLAASGVHGGEGSGSDIGYGGIDSDGTGVPESRRRQRSVWDEDEEEF